MITEYLTRVPFDWHETAARHSSTTAVVTGKGWGDYSVSRQNSKWLSYARYGNVTTDTKCKQIPTTGLVFPSGFWLISLQWFRLKK